MKKLIFILISLIITDLAIAQKQFISSNLVLKTQFENDESSLGNEMQRRRSKGRRGRMPLFAAGGSLTTMNILNSDFDDKFRFGLGANGWYNISLTNAINGGIYYFFPSGKDTLDWKNTSSYFLISIHFQQFIVGSNKEDFGFYALGGFGYIVNFNNTETPEFDINARYTNINIDLGVGAQFNLGFGYLYTELQGSLGLMKFEIPTNPADGMNVPSYINFRAGMKIPLQF